MMFNKRSNKIISRVLVFLMIMMTTLSYLPVGVSPVVGNAEALSVSIESDLALTAIRNNYEEYINGAAVDGKGYTSFTSYDAYILMKAGVDISQWEYDGSTFEEEVVNLIDATLADPDSASAKRLAQDYLAADAMGETEKATSLSAILVEKQNMNGSFDNSVYSDFPALDMLAREDGLIDLTIDIDTAVENILSNQDVSGGWPQSYEYVWEGVTNTAFSDFVSTAEAVRILTLVEDETSVTPSGVTAAIENGMEWLQNKQQEGGGYIAGYDDSVTDTSEMIYTAIVLEDNILEWVKEGKSPVDFMMYDALVNGSFGNIMSTTWALDGYLNLGAAVSSNEALGLTVDIDKLSIYNGESTRVSATSLNVKGSSDLSFVVEWVSSNEEVATVDADGNVTAVGVGTSTITGQYDEFQDIVEITVNTSGSDLALTAIRNNYEEYINGAAVDGKGYTSFTSYDAYILMKAGVDISQWEYAGSTFEEEVVNLIDATLADPDSASAKRLAQDYLAADAMGETEKATSLSAILVEKQNMNGSFDNSVYSDFPALDMLAREDGLIDSTIDIDTAVENILSNQDVSGGWPQSYEYVWEGVTNTAFSDFVSTAEAVRILTLVEDETSVTPSGVTAAIENGMEWLQNKQQEGGGYIAGYDDSVTDTSEMIYTAIVLEDNILEWVKEGKSPVDFMMYDALVNGSFGNIMSTTWALDGYLNLGAAVSSNEALGLTVDIDKLSIYNGESTRVSATSLNVKGSSDLSSVVEWVSSNEEVATVDADGNVTAVGVGTSTITGQYDEFQDIVEITVNSNENDLALIAIANNYETYTSGTLVDGGGYSTFSSYDAYILMKAGVDISQWEYDGSNLKSDVIALIDETLSDSELASAKRVAQDYLAADVMGESQKSTSLSAILVDKQQIDGMFDNNMYSDFPALDMLAREDRLLDSGLNINNIVTNIIDNQDVTGAWNAGYNDFMSTVEAIRILNDVKEETTVTSSAITAAIDEGMTWLLANQNTDGSFQIGYDDPAGDTSEMIYTAMVMGYDLNLWKSNQGNSPIDYMLDGVLNEGKFGTYGNIMGCTWSLDAYLQLGALIQGITVTPETVTIYDETTKQFTATAVEPDGTVINITNTAKWSTTDPKIADIDENGLLTAKKTGTIKVTASYGSTNGIATLKIINRPVSNDFSVYVAVIGKNDELLYGPRRVTISEDDKYEDTALGALDATNLDFDFSDDEPDMVDEIEGQKNSGMNGWMYSVNGKAPTVLPGYKRVNSGNKVLFWYSTSTMEGSPDWPSSSSSSTKVPTIDTDEVKETLEEYIVQLNDGTQRLNLDKMMTEKEADDLAKELKKNNVSLSANYEGQDTVLSDDEVSILVRKGALEDDIKLTVDEIDSKDKPQQFAVKIGSSVYEFGPNGTKFDEAVTISITLPIYKNSNLENLKPAWFDEESGKWVTIPCIVDLETGMITFEIDHFTKFAIIESEKRVEFSDVDDNMNWARDAIEVLAGQGIINGTGYGFAPQRSITRAEFIKLVVEALKLEKDEIKGDIFEDVNIEDWFAAYVECSYNNNIVTGDPDGNFRPNDVISRNEIAVILSRLNGIDDMDDVVLEFDDALDIPEWSRIGVEFVNRTELMKGYEDNTFKGNNALSRAEAAVVIYRYMNYYLNNQ